MVRCMALRTIAGQILGRRKTVFLGQVITMIGAALQASSYGLGQMIAARVITGVGIGHITSTVPVWSVSVPRHCLAINAG